MKIWNRNISNKIILLLIVLFGALLRIAMPVGMQISGDISHLYFSYKASKGDLNLNPYDLPTSTRIGFVYPTAFFYRVFGVSEFSSYAFSLLMGILSIPLIYLLGKLFFNEEIALMSAFLLSFYPLNVNYATQAFADIAQSFFTGLSVYFFFLGEKKIPKRQYILYFLSGIAAGVSVLIKETGIVIFFFFAVFILYKLIFRKEKIRSSCISIFVGFSLIMAIQVAHDYMASGDLILRYHQAKFLELQIGDIWNYHGYKLLERLFVHIPYLMLTNFNFGFFAIFFIMALAYAIQFKKREAWPAAIWFSSLLFYINFASISLNKYVPQPGGTPRYMETLTFPGILLISCFLMDKNILIKKFIRPFGIIFLLLTSMGFVYINPDRHNADVERELGRFFETSRHIPIYADESTKEALDFFTEYKYDIRSYWRHNYPVSGSIDLINPEEIRNAHVVVNKRVFNKTPANYNITYPKVYYNAPKSWILLKTIKNNDGDALIYYAP